MSASLPSRLREVSEELRNLPNVLGVGFGLKECRGELTSERAWRIYVSEKVPSRLLAASARVPSTLFGIRTDVVPKRDTRSSKAPRLARGDHIANSDGVPGTLGCLVRRADDTNQYLLTNAHVLLGGKGAIDDPIWWVEHGPNGSYQCHFIGNTVKAKVGVVKYGGEPHFIDGAIGRLEPRVRIGDRFASAASIRCPDVGENVTKIGAISGLTCGVVVDVSYPDFAYIAGKSLQAPNQLLVAPLESTSRFSESGDSGALIVDEENSPVGLLWGSNANGEGVACHLAPVLTALDVFIEKPRLGLLQRVRDRVLDLRAKRHAKGRSA